MAKKQLILRLNDTTVYVHPTSGALVRGTVTRVTAWTDRWGQIGYTYRVEHQYGEHRPVGEIQWGNRYLFKEGDPIPDDILREHHLTDDAPAEDLLPSATGAAAGGP